MEHESLSKRLRKMFVFFVFAFFIASLVPVSFAEESSERSGVNVNSEVYVETSNSGSDSESNSEVNADVKAESRQRISAEERKDSRIEKRDQIKEKRQEKIENILENRAEIRKDRIEINAEDKLEIRKERFEDIRAHQKEKMMTAVELCKERTNDSEKCKDMFEKRIALIANLSEKDAERLDDIKERREQKMGDLREMTKLGLFKKFDDKKEFKARVLSNIKIRAANEDFLEAKANFSASKKKFDEQKKELQSIKKELKECSKSDSEECKKVNAQAKVHASAGLESAALAMISNLQKIKAKVNESEDLTENESAEIIAKLDAKITAIESVKIKIDALNENSTSEEIRALAKELKTTWKSAENEAKKHAGRIVSSKIGGIVVRLKHLEIKLERTLEKAAEQGKNTSEVESLVAEFNSKLELSKEKHKASVDAYLEAKTQEDFKKASDLLKESQNALNEAHQKLKEIFKELKDLRVEVESEAEADIEAEAEESVNSSVNASSSATA